MTTAEVHAAPSLPSLARPEREGLPPRADGAVEERPRLRIGIDLGTTFCCCALLDDVGQPALVPWPDREVTLPSVFWFDGRTAVFGAAAYEWERERPGGLCSFFKRDMGRPATLPPNLFDQPDAPKTAPYAFDGFAFGVVGMQALLLRAVKRQAIRHAVAQGQLPAHADEFNVSVEAVITVPAYFKDVPRQQTRQAGEIAGLRVAHILNEPTAAALAYRLHLHNPQLLFVFDLGGGTFDVTVLQSGRVLATASGDDLCAVLATDGLAELGGKDWDDRIAEHLHDEAFRSRRRTMPEAFGPCLHRLAVAAKIALTDHPAVRVKVPVPEEEPVDVLLLREAPPTANPFDFDDPTYYLDRRSQDLLALVRAICENVRQSVRLPSPGGDRTMQWDDLNEVVMVGGASRMPLVAAELERITGRRVQQHPQGFDFDTAVAIGAARHLAQPHGVRDVASTTVGVLLLRIEDNVTHRFVQPLIRKNAPLPVSIEREYAAGAHAHFLLYEGESHEVPLCTLRGRLDLDNPEGSVVVRLAMDADGHLTASVQHPGASPTDPAVTRTLRIANERFDTPLAELADRIRRVVMIDDGPTRPSPSDPCGGEGSVVPAAL